MRRNHAQFTHTTLCQLTPKDQTLSRVRDCHLTAVEGVGCRTILELQAQQKSTSDT
jgi:hypothetical protein